MSWRILWNIKVLSQFHNVFHLPHHDKEMAVLLFQSIINSRIYAHVLRMTETNACVHHIGEDGWFSTVKRGLNYGRRNRNCCQTFLMYSISSYFSFVHLEFESTFWILSRIKISFSRRFAVATSKVNIVYNNR